QQLEEWMRSYLPDELFGSDGAPRPYLLELAPSGTRRMGLNRHANGGAHVPPLKLPPIAPLGVPVERPGQSSALATRVLGQWLREVFRLNAQARNFRLFSPDETSSNRLDAVFDETGRAWMGELRPGDNVLRVDGRVMEVLSEHQCQGWLEGYLLTGRHGLFSCYEAFIHIIDSMFNQHAKWLEAARKIPWRKPIASLNILLSSHVWRQDHNGFSHQDPGFIDVVLNKKPDVVRVYLPPDANTLLCVAEHCLRSYNRVNVIVAGKNSAPQWLGMDAAVRHCDAGIGIFEFASNDGGGAPDVVLACAGDVPTVEVLAAVAMLRRHLPDLKTRVVNVVDLMTLQPREEHPHGLTDVAFDALFTTDRPVIFAHHGYPWLIHRLTYRRCNHANLHVRGYKEEGSTTTPFDMVVRNALDRFHLVIDVIDRTPQLGYRAAHVRQLMCEKLVAHEQYIRATGEDLPEVCEWVWPAPRH
ncbi:MAG TPA: phosphoketolase family protein, partial [Steroidobacteraceae bacterium]